MSFKNTFPIEIPKRAHVCAKGGEALEAGMEYYSVITGETEENKFSRQDFCLDCWKNMASEFLKTARSCWKSMVPQKFKEIALPKAREERIFHLFRELSKSSMLEEQAEAFVLALYLARKKKLVMRQQMQRTEEIIQVYEAVENEEIFCIKKFPLSALETEKIQLALAKKING